MSTCEQTGGFLFQHACGLPAGAQCMRCGKSVCDAHLVSTGGELLCQSCGREESAEDDEAEAERGEDDPSYYYEDYGAYGSGSSHDPNDFTVADGESLRHEGDASFEEDLGGS